MDFNYLLEIAKMNEQKNKQDDAKFFPSKLSKAKKVERPSPSGDAVKAILSQKQKDQRKKDLKFIKDRKELLERRALDKKNYRKVHSMIHRTKGACKSVLDEAKDLITVNGEEQCDADDYGYESNMSQQIFDKLTTQYKAAPEDDRLKFKKKATGDLADIKSRVMDSLKRKHEEETGVRKRHRTTKKKRRSKEGDTFINDGDPYGELRKSPSPPAQPLEEEKKAPVVKKSRKPMPPPMSFHDLLNMAKQKQKEPMPLVVEVAPKEPAERPLTAKEKAEKESERKRLLRRMNKHLPDPAAPPRPKAEETSSVKHAKAAGRKSAEAKPAAPEPKKVIDRSKYFAVPSASNAPVRKEAPAPRIVREHSAPLRKPVRPPPPPVSRIESDESEYDSEMDDFIDDGDTEMDVASEIGKIFGYDKTKYKHIDEEDDSSMVASYSQMEQEEKRSAKIGIQEDLEDMRMEEMARKRKLSKKMQLQKSAKWK